MRCEGSLQRPSTEGWIVPCPECGKTVFRMPSGWIPVHNRTSPPATSLTTGSKPQKEGSMQEHVVLIAVQVSAETFEQAQRQVIQILPKIGNNFPTGLGDDNSLGIECWWIAEDERIDGSDNGSAVFVDKGNQDEACSVLKKAGLA